jgi:GAF domain-containing protein
MQSQYNVCMMTDALASNSVLPAVQKPPVTFDMLFYKQLQQITTRILESHSVEEVIKEASQDICQLLNADRLTYYAVSSDQTFIIAKVKTDLNVSLKLPITPQSIAGYCAFSKQLLNLPDVYNGSDLKRIHPSLKFFSEVDKRSGYKTRQMLVAPIHDGKILYGVLQIINNKNDKPFDERSRPVMQNIGSHFARTNLQ